MNTEKKSQSYAAIETWPYDQFLEAILKSNVLAIENIRTTFPVIESAIRQAIPGLQEQGRIIYVGCGASGRLGVQDGVELVPTYGFPADRIIYLMAGGQGALTLSVEGAEDDHVAGENEIAFLKPQAQDLVIGVAASGNTPYTVAALAYAKAQGATTIGIANNEQGKLLSVVDFPLYVNSGPEVIAGSTRMAAGTGQKVILNMISTVLMAKMGRVYDGLMVDMRAQNIKLYQRAITMVQRISDCDEATAKFYLEENAWHIKTAALAAIVGDSVKAKTLLKEARGYLQTAIDLGK